MGPPELPPGSRLGAYRVEELLGRGGMGAVYRAVDERDGRVVALKVLLPTEDDNAFARFDREARALAAIDHPNVIRVHASGSAAGWPFLALELLTGGTLEDKLKRAGALAWPEAVRYGAEIARGLSALHAAGLVHRDLKPANVLLDTEGRARISDLGLVRRLPGAAQSRNLTEEGAIVGTPNFLSPEQADQRDVGPAADLYALGATLYALVAGRPPFEGEIVAVLMKHLTAPPAPLRSRAPRIPAAFDALVMRLLAKKPELRGESAVAVAAELERILRAESIADVHAKTRVQPALVAAPATRRASGWRVQGAALAGLAAVVLAVALVSRRGSGTPSVGGLDAVGSAAVTSTGATGESPAASQGSPISLRELRRTKERLWMTAEDNFASGVAFVPGQPLAVVAGDGRLWVFDLRDGSLRHALASGTRIGFGALACSPDGRRVAAALVSGGGVSVWSLETGALERAFLGGAPPVTALAWLGDRILLAGEKRAEAREGVVHELDVASGAVTDLFRTEGTIRALSVAREGELVLFSDDDGAHLVKVATGAKVLIADTKGASRASLVANGVVAFLLQEGRAVLCSLESGERSVVLEDVEDAAISADGRRVALLTRNGRQVVVRDLDAPVLRGPLPSPPCRTTSWLLGKQGRLALSPDGRKLLTATWDARVRLWSVGATVARVSAPDEGPGAALVCLDATAAGDRIVGACRDGTLWEWDAETLEARWSRDAVHGELTSVAITPQGDRILTGGYSGRARLWAGGAELGAEVSGSGPPGFVPVAFAPDGRFAVGFRDGRVEVYSAEGIRETSFVAHCEWLKRLAFTPRGIYACSERDKPALYARSSPGAPYERERVYAGMPGLVMDFDLCQTSIGERLAAGSATGEVRLWPASPEKEKGLRAFRSGEGERVLAVTLLERGRVIVAGYEDGVLRVHAMDSSKRDEPAAELSLAPDRATSLIALDERTFVVGTNRGMLLKYELVRSAKR